MVRRATNADAEAIARVWILSWQQAYAHAFPPEVFAALTVEERTRHALEMIRSRGWGVFVSDGDEDLAGYAAVGPSEELDGCGELYAIYVDAAHWGSGVAQALLERSEDELRARGFGDAVLRVLADNPRARRFYERNGWVAGESLRVPIRGHEVDVVRYRKDLSARVTSGPES